MTLEELKELQPGNERYFFYEESTSTPRKTYWVVTPCYTDEMVVKVEDRPLFSRWVTKEELEEAYRREQELEEK